MPEKSGAIIACRMSSERLPGKTLMPICGKPMLELLIQRVKRSKALDKVVIATTTDASDDPIQTLCSELDIRCYRGSRDNVLERFIMAARDNQLEIAVRITGDCPLMDGEIIDDVVALFKSRPCDYASNVLKRTYARGWDVEVVRLTALRKIYNQSPSQAEKEHVTCGIYQRPNEFVCVNLEAPAKWSLPEARLCVDTQEDFELVRKIFEALYPKNLEFSWKDVVGLLRSNPDWLKINSSVRQKSF